MPNPFFFLYDFGLPIHGTKHDYQFSQSPRFYSRTRVQMLYARYELTVQNHSQFERNSWKQKYVFTYRQKSHRIQAHCIHVCHGIEMPPCFRYCKISYPYGTHTGIEIFLSLYSTYINIYTYLNVVLVQTFSIRFSYYYNKDILWFQPFSVSHFFTNIRYIWKINLFSVKYISIVISLFSLFDTRI